MMFRIEHSTYETKIIFLILQGYVFQRYCTNPRKESSENTSTYVIIII